MGNNKLSWDDFSKVEMRVGTILTAEVFKEVRNPAYKITIDFGDIGKKNSSAQLTKLYSAEELIGKQVVCVVNFPPKQIANMKSECLILGALGEGNEVTLLSTDKKVENGQSIG